MKKEAEHKQAPAVERNGKLYWQRLMHVVREISKNAQSASGKAHHDPSRIGLRRMKRDDEAEEIRRERQNPEQGNSGDILAEVVGKGAQQKRRASRQQKPQS